MNKYIKVSSKDIYIPQKLLDHIIKESDVMPVTIEEEQSEIFFGSCSGLGKIVFKNSSIFDGNVKYGILDSGDEKRVCTLTFPNDTKYEGQISSNKVTGNGSFKFNSGSTYTGELKNGLRNGKGIFKTVDDGLIYDGEWENGLKNGYGVFTIKDESTYEGDWVEGIKHGNGRIKWVTGNLFDGEFKNNLINGNGYMIWYDTNEKYTGQWIDNLQNGLGIQIWYENKGEQKYLRNRYVGEWKNGFRHGYGIFFYSNGAKYEGMWDQNYKHGFGVFTFQDGEQYIGRFHNDKMIDYNIYGFSIPNVSASKSHNMNDRVSSANSKQGGSATKGKINAGSKGNSDIKGRETTESIKNLDEITNNKTLNPISEKGNKESSASGSNSAHGDNNNNTNVNKIEISRKGSSNAKGNNINNMASGSGTLDPISEQAELFNMSVLMPDNISPNNNQGNINLNMNNINNNPMAMSADNTKLNNNSQLKNTGILSSKNVANFIKEKKEKEFNIFKTLIDVSDLIDCDPEIESNLRDVENTLLRHLSEMKMWYRYYTVKENSKEENQSVNASVDDRISIKDHHSERKINYKHEKSENISNEIKEKNKVSISPIDKLEGVYSNDLAFGMELKDLWKFLRESNILCLEFSLAQFNRLFFKGNKNYIEMFMYPEEVNGKSKIYDYIYHMINKSKSDFSFKYRDRLFTLNITNNLFGQATLNTNVGNMNNTNDTFKGNNDNNSIDYNSNNNGNEHNNAFSSSKKNKKDEINFNYFNDNIHNKRQTILLRHFYEAILRSAYLRYSHLSVSLHSKINNLIDTCIKTNINFKKVSRKSQMQTESSINSSVIVDMKQKSFESNFEFFSGNFESRLKLSFKKLFNKSTTHNRVDDMTVTYRFFYEKIVKKSETILSHFDIIKFIELINIYHKDKQTFTEGQKITREQFIYIENLLDLEFIFYEYCELIFFLTRKILTKNNLNETKENYSTQISDIEELIDNMESAVHGEKLYYSYPKLSHHLKFENLIATQKAREEEELRKKLEQKRVELERNLMQVEDTNILPEFNEEDDLEEDSSMYSNY